MSQSHYLYRYQWREAPQYFSGFILRYTSQEKCDFFWDRKHVYDTILEDFKKSLNFFKNVGEVALIQNMSVSYQSLILCSVVGMSALVEVSSNLSAFQVVLSLRMGYWDAAPNPHKLDRTQSILALMVK